MSGPNASSELAAPFGGRIAAMAHGSIPSPVGVLGLAASATGVVAVRFGPEPGESPGRPGDAQALRHLDHLRRELDAYFAGSLRRFIVPLDLRGTAFRLQTWAALREIPFGTTISYGELARRVDRPTGQRAVGAANGANPIAIVVPCHRVIAADGSLHGYGGGLERKAWLLEHEQRTLCAAGRAPVALF